MFQFDRSVFFKINSCICCETGGPVEAFGKLNPRLRGVGLATVLGGFILAINNSLVLAWTGIYFTQSFDPSNEVPWKEEGAREFLNQFILKVKLVSFLIILMRYKCSYTNVQ